MTSVKPEIDTLAILGAYVQSPGAFAKGAATAQKAAAAILLAQVQNSDLSGLKALVTLVGSASVQAVLQGMARPALVRIVQRIVPAPRVVRTETATSLAEKLTGWILGEGPETPPPFDKVDLAGLREWRNKKDFDFDGWLASNRRLQGVTLKRLDQNLPGRPSPSAVQTRLQALATGASPFRDHRLSKMELQDLQDAYADLGETFFPLWISAVDVGTLRTALAKMDPHRAGVQRMNRRDASAFLSLLAKGESQVANPSAPLEEIRFPRPDFGAD